MSAELWATLAVFGCLLAGCALRPAHECEPRPVRGDHLITVADDFVIDVYLDGIVVPDEKRELLVERFGATVEKINLSVHQGDWLVFHVANNRLRWSGNYYFAAAGILGTNEFGFVSDTTSGQWSVCDNPARSQRFIRHKNYLQQNGVQRVTHPWEEGTPYMKQFAGPDWAGEPIWGLARDTWVKVIVK